MSNANPIRALVFDFDGLILDTETPEYMAWQTVFSDRNCELPLETWSLNIGTHGVVDPYALLAELSGQPVNPGLIRGQVRAYYSAIAQEQELLPGVMDYLETARALGIRLAVASSSKHEWVDPHLHKFKIWDYFQTVVCADDVAQVKPDPALYELALARLDVGAQVAVALEDSPNGVLAAKAAGMFCVFVPNPITVNLRTKHADIQVTSLAEFPLEDLLATFGRG